MFTKYRCATALATLVAGSLALSACSELAEDSGSQSSSKAEEATLTVYTSEPEEKVDEINQAFMAANPSIKVEVYRAGTGDLKARIASEKQSGKVGADVLWAADAVTFEGYAKDGLLTELSGVNTDDVIEEAKDTENFYVGTRIIPTVIAYNTGVVEEKDAPKSWADLTDPKFKDKLVMPDPAVSGAAAFNASVWKNSPELGSDWITALGQNHPMIAQSNGPASQEIAGGGHPVGVVVDYLVRDLAKKGSPVAVSYPSEGVPYVTEPAGIFADSSAKDAAQKYLEFLLSEEGQKLAAKQNYLPVRRDAASPEGTKALKDIKLMTPKLEQVVADQDAAVKAFQQAVAG